MSKLLTLKEIAKQLDIPESSLRKYREIFSKFIPSVGSGRSRRYRNEAIGILAEIREMREDMHMPWDAISDHLAEKYPMDATPEDGDAEESGESAPAPQSVLPAPSSDQLVRRMNAISERQTMMVNAVAMEIVRSIESVRDDTRRETTAMQVGFANAMQNLAESLSIANRQEQALLRDIQNRVAALGKKMENLEKAKPAPAPAPPPEPKKMPDNNSAAKIADLNKSLQLAKEQLLKKDKTISDFKKALQDIKAENARLTEVRRQYSQMIERENEETEPPEPRRRRASSSSESQKPSLVKKIFGIK